MAGLMIRVRKKKHEFVNMLGFNMGFITEIGRSNGGFNVSNPRKFDNSLKSGDFVEESEDGTMALNLLKTGKLKLVRTWNARVFTSDRRLIAEGGLAKSFLSRLKQHGGTLLGYLLKRK